MIKIAALIDKELFKLLEDVAVGSGEKERRIYTEEYEKPDAHEKKIEEVNPLGLSIEPGSKVEIRWKQFDEPDRGYILTLPGFDSDDIYMSGIVHIPLPQGGDKGPPLPEWIYLGRLLSLPGVVKVRIFGR